MSAAVLSCTLCPSGDAPHLLDLDLSALSALLPPAIVVQQSSRNGTAINATSAAAASLTCGDVAAALLASAGTAAVAEAACAQVRAVAAAPCGCPPVPDPCVFCPSDPGGVPFPDRIVQRLRAFGAPPAPCRSIELLLLQKSRSDPTCPAFRAFLAYLCGCDGGVRPYLASTSTRRQALFLWLPRTTAMVSFVCSAVLIYLISCDSKKKRTALSTYQSLLVAMSLFDLVQAGNWILGTLPVPVYDQYGEPTGIFGARGNDATCRAQGFFYQLGTTAGFYYVALSLYFLIVVKFHQRPARLHRYRCYFLGLPLVLGLALSFAGLPHYATLWFGCYILPPPYADPPSALYIFGTGPLMGAMLVSAVSTVVGYLEIRKRDRRARPWRAARFSNSTNPSIDPRSSAASSSGNTEQGILPAPASPAQENQQQQEEEQQQRSAEPAPVNAMEGGPRNSTITAASGHHPRSPVEREIFWQSFGYMCVFFVVFSLNLVLTFLTRTGFVNYELILATLTLAPCQGIGNLIVYLKPWNDLRGRFVRTRVQTRSTNATQTVLVSFGEDKVSTAVQPNNNNPASFGGNMLASEITQSTLVEKSIGDDETRRQEEEE
jgi:hypothetical protein